jgi:hypothetical protein
VAPVSEEKTNASTAACAACFAGEIAWVYTSRVDRNEECRRSSCITLNSAPTLRNRVVVGVSEGMPTDLFLDSEAVGDGLNVSA